MTFGEVSNVVSAEAEALVAENTSHLQKYAAHRGVALHAAQAETARVCTRFTIVWHQLTLGEKAGNEPASLKTSNMGATVPHVYIIPIAAWRWVM